VGFTHWMAEGGRPYVFQKKRHSTTAAEKTKMNLAARAGWIRKGAFDATFLKNDG
jgi:hypothetical protein